VPRLEEASGFTIVISDPDLLLGSQFDATLSRNHVFESTCAGIVPHICRLHPCSNHTEYGWHITLYVVNKGEGGDLGVDVKPTDAKDSLEQLINLYILRVFMSDPLQVPSVDYFHDLIRIPPSQR